MLFRPSAEEPSAPHAPPPPPHPSFANGHTHPRWLFLSPAHPHPFPTLDPRRCCQSHPRPSCYQPQHRNPLHKATRGAPRGQPPSLAHPPSPRPPCPRARCAAASVSGVRHAATGKGARPVAKPIGHVRHRRAPTITQPRPCGPHRAPRGGDALMCCQWTSSRRETKILKEKRAYRLGLFVHMDTAPRHQPTAPQPPSPSHCSPRGGDVWMSCCTRRSGRSGGASEAAWSDDQLPWTWGPAHHGSHPASCVCPSGHRSRNDWAHHRQVRSDPSGYPS